jgi:transglutaminase-like putative cysteine protease
VLKEVSELTINLNAPSKQVDQILILRNYVRKNWHYIFDPDSGHDTFRSAEATISLKHKGKYPGDCDDYAILMASFARQIGLKSRVVGAYKNNGNGHAFAEFLVPEIDTSNPLLNGNDYRNDNYGKWISLDWFIGAEHRAYKYDVRIIAQ